MDFAATLSMGQSPLAVGPTLLVQYLGRQQQREAVVHGFTVVLAVACERFEVAGSKAVALCYEMSFSSATWEEQ